MKKFNIIYKLLIIHILLFNNLIATTFHNTKKQNKQINYTPTFQSKKNISLIYNPTGQLTCKLIIQSVQYSHNIQTTYFFKPVAILFNQNNIPIWNIQAKEAKITNNNKIVYLYGNVQINNLKKNSYLQSIKTNTATLNLITYDIFSNNTITIYGEYFKTTAMNMKGNLHTKITEFSPKVKTMYERKKSKNIL